MKFSKANIAGLSSMQRAEMKAILAGAWPPLKPLPVFKYETVAFRAIIHFDKLRGEWVCRKTFLPSNTVQELRGGLQEITASLPHGEAEIYTEDAEQQEQESEKDANRRFEAIHEWRENYKSGALYFELRDYLPERQRTEMDDSFRLSLTARQLQFSAKNLEYVFDALSIAGGRFATLIEFAKRSKAKQGTAPKAQGKESVSEAERGMDHDRQSLGGSRNIRLVEDGHGAGHSSHVDEFPAISITNVLPERGEASWSERIARDDASQQSEIDNPEIVENDASSGSEHAYQGGHPSSAFSSFIEQARASQASADGIDGARSRLPEISAFQIAACGTLFLFAVLAFTFGLIVGRRPQGSRFLEVPKSMLANHANPPAPSDQARKSTSSAPQVAISNDSAETQAHGDIKSAEEKSKDSDPSPTAESKTSAVPEVNSDRSGAIRPIASRSPASQWLTPKLVAAPHLPRPSAILVTPPSRGGQPFRVSFPEKAFAATSSFAMSSQLSVLVSAEPRAATAHKPARLEAGELVSFVWPRFLRTGDPSGLAESIKVRVTIGQLGRVLEVKFLGGSISLLPATTRAIRQWSYRPTLLDKRPVQAQQDVTIEFRPPQYSSRLSSRHPLPK